MPTTSGVTRRKMPPKLGESISEGQQKRLLLQEATCDFLVKAQQIFDKRPSNNNTFLRRYYRLEINSQIDPDEHNIESIVKCSRDSVACLRCGSEKVLKVERRQEANKSRFRKYCRRLKGLLIVKCDKCSHRNSYKLKSRKSLFATLDQLRNYNSNVKQSSAKIGHPETSLTQSPPDRVIHLPKRSKKKKKLKVEAKAPQIQHNKTPKQMVKRKLRNNQQKPELVAINPTSQKAQFSSRLRAFSCLLK